MINSAWLVTCLVGFPAGILARSASDECRRRLGPSNPWQQVLKDVRILISALDSRIFRQTYLRLVQQLSRITAVQIVTALVAAIPVAAAYFGAAGITGLMQSTGVSNSDVISARSSVGLEYAFVIVVMAGSLAGPRIFGHRR